MHVFVAFTSHPERTVMNADAAQHSSGVTGQPCWLFSSDLFHSGLISALITAGRVEALNLDFILLLSQMLLIWLTGGLLLFLLPRVTFGSLLHVK